MSHQSIQHVYGRVHTKRVHFSVTDISFVVLCCVLAQFFTFSTYVLYLQHVIVPVSFACHHILQYFWIYIFNFYFLWKGYVAFVVTRVPCVMNVHSAAAFSFFPPPAHEQPNQSDVRTCSDCVIVTQNMLATVVKRALLLRRNQCGKKDAADWVSSTHDRTKCDQGNGWTPTTWEMPRLTNVVN